MSDVFLKVENLKKSFFHLGAEIPVLKNVDFSMSPGQSLAIVGQSGVGKSTFLHCLGLLDRIDGGKIYYGSNLVSNAEDSKSAHLARTLQRRKSIGFVFQFHYLMAELTALENVEIPLLLERMDPVEAAEKARAALKNVGLDHRLVHRPSQLSGGEQQRVAIARALVHQPSIILADEPTGNLDPKTAEDVFQVLKEQCLRFKAILVMATHNHSLADFLDRKCSLVEGRLQ